jgi:hypothetical protein
MDPHVLIHLGIIHSPGKGTFTTTLLSALLGLGRPVAITGSVPPHLTTDGGVGPA